MKTFFLILFFSETVLLTRDPIAIGNEYVEITPKETFSAITGGAAIYIDVSSHVPDGYTLTEQFEFVDKRFPDESVQGVIIDKNGREYSITNEGSSHAHEDVRLIVRHDSSMPTNVDFDKVKLKSRMPMEHVSVFWKNFTM